MKPVLAVTLSSLLLLFNCSHRTYRWIIKGIIPNTDHISRKLGKGNHKLKILYTGCGGLLIEHGTDVLMTDPYYTSHRPKQVFNKIHPDSSNLKKVMERVVNAGIDPKKITTVLISHSHYDHLEDLPGLLAGKHLATKVKLIGSKSTSCTVTNFLAGHEFINVDSTCYLQGKPKAEEASWLKISDRIRILPIHSQHADHFYGGISRMSGLTICKNFENYTKPNDETVTDHWREGGTFSFLIDLINDDKKTLRIFIQTSSCSPPSGFPPPEDLKEKSVDLAILCVASHAYADKYPNELLSHIKPRQVALIHWEDFFFKSMYVPDPKNVALTAIAPFMKKMRKHYKVDAEHLKDSIVMPRPLTLVEWIY